MAKGALKSSGPKIIVAFVVGALFGAVVVAQVAPNLTTTTAVGSLPGQQATDPGLLNPSVSPTGASTVPGANPTGFNPSGQAGAACAAGRNGGATDKGVTATEIKLATTVVRSGVGAAFLGDVQFAMEAVRNKVNRAGGICGRQLSIKYVDDGWRADLGHAVPAQLHPGGRVRDPRRALERRPQRRHRDRRHQPSRRSRSSAPTA